MRSQQSNLTYSVVHVSRTAVKYSPCVRYSPTCPSRCEHSSSRCKHSSSRREHSSPRRERSSPRRSVRLRRRRGPARRSRSVASGGHRRPTPGTVVGLLTGKIERLWSVMVQRKLISGGIIILIFLT